MRTKHVDFYNKIRFTVAGAVAVGFALYIIIDCFPCYGHVDLIEPTLAIELRIMQVQRGDPEPDWYEEYHGSEFQGCDPDSGWMGSSKD